MFFIVFCVLVNIKFKCINFSRLYVRAVYMRAKKASKVTDYLYIFQIYCVRFLVLIIFTNFVV